MDLSIYFSPLDYTNSNYSNDDLGCTVQFHNSSNGFPNFEDFDLVILGVKEERNSYKNKGCKNGPDAIRSKLYSLKSNWNNRKIADLGNIEAGESVTDTYYAVNNVIAECVKSGVLPIILGGSQDLTYANYEAYEKLEQVVNIVSVDRALDLGDVEEGIRSNGYLNKIILHQPNYLFNYSNIGYQTYFVSEEERKLMDRLHFDIHRFGEVKADIKEVEPVVRNADILSFDISSIRSSDAGACEHTTPNGFNGEEACSITRYAGLSDKLTSFGLYEYNPDLDTNGQTAFLIAEMIWYFVEGFYNRKGDVLHKRNKDLLKYIVTTNTEVQEIVFYKNLVSDRWWLDVPYPESKLSKYRRHQLVPCSYADYQKACNDTVPEKWWSNYRKFK
ncbi:MAG: arginase [Crocinitomicaceae bacterium]|nr:arginase [Crocinitomicaceae bacterium]|tara:strand:+ start:10527 stop:11690 length:1164 start_codon:yes stop_codon:yes gene_type:complete